MVRTSIELSFTLQKHSEHDDGQSGGQEHLGRRDITLIDHRDKREAHRPPETAIRHDELLLQTDRVDVLTEKVNKESKTINGEKSDNSYDHNSKEDKACVPNMLLKESHPKI